MNTFANNLLCSKSRPFHKEILLLRKWSHIVLFPLLHGMTDFQLMVVSGSTGDCGRTQRSITMMQISKRHIKMRQKLINRFWRFWRACWGISMVEALLIAERVRYWTLSMVPGRQGAWSFKCSRERYKAASQVRLLLGSLECKE